MRATARILDIEVLRALAVLFVVVFHADGNLLASGQLFGGQIHRYFGGWVGVDLFFAISGFVIARSLLPVLQAAPDATEYRRRTVTFWLRRAVRLLPSAWLWLGVILLLQMFFNESGVFGSLGANLWSTLAGVLNVANFRFADSFGAYEYGTSFVYWSLSLEEQFYLLLPILFFVLRRYLPWLLIFLVIWQLPEERGLFEMATRSDAISLGILIALFSGRNSYHFFSPENRPILRFCYRLCIILGLLALPYVGSFSQDQIHFQLGLIASISGLIVFCCSFDQDLLARGPWTPALVWLGARSYAIYLIHIPAFYVVRECAYRLGLKPQNPELTLVLALAFILLLADLNFRFVETRLRIWFYQRSGATSG